MPRRKKPGDQLSWDKILAVVPDQIRPPLAVVLGSPRETADLVAELKTTDIACYQMDLYQAGRLEQELGENGLIARVVTAADLWDLHADFQTVIYPVPQGGERILKQDMIEQAFHILKPRGTLLVSSPYEKDHFFPSALKKIFGRVHAPMSGQGQILWCRREGDRLRRRHELTFQVRMDANTSLRFLSRPGVFSYGRFDDGARALVETMEVRPGDRVLDIGCGCGTNGVWASRLSGPEGFTVFGDSNVRAIALAEINAQANGVPGFQALATCTMAGMGETRLDVVLANPPYYAQLTIAQLFIERSRDLLRPGGRFYLVTKQPDQVGPLVADFFGRTEVVERRGYIVLSARAR
jgi:16S rRNA (guanine1207-N2)-methyltransferase